MAAALDHLVYATNDLAATVASVEAALGVTTSPGGQHVGLGTRNHLLSFGDGSYLEIVGPDLDQPSPDQPRSFGIDDLDGPRLVTWVIRVDDMDTALSAARSVGFDPGPARSMQRATPTGDLLSWRLTPAFPLGEGLIPFLIDWGATIHPSMTATGGISLASLRAEHPEPDGVVRALSTLGVAGMLTVEVGPTASLIATVAGPAGLLVLN